MNRIDLLIKNLLAAILFTGLCLPSCTKAPLAVEYHNLTVDVGHSIKPEESTPTLLIGPVQVNSFLTQGPIAKQHSTNSVNLLEQHHWAGNLDEMLLEALTQNLVFELGSEKIYTYPDTSSNTGIRLAVNFSHFEENTTGNALLQARWKIVHTADQTVLYSNSTTKTRTPDSSSYDALAKALSECLTDLSIEIANGIRQIQSTLQPTQEKQK